MSDELRSSSRLREDQQRQEEKWLNNRRSNEFKRWTDTKHKRLLGLFISLHLYVHVSFVKLLFEASAQKKNICHNKTFITSKTSVFLNKNIQSPLVATWSCKTPHGRWRSTEPHTRSTFCALDLNQRQSGRFWSSELRETGRVMLLQLNSAESSSGSGSDRTISEPRPQEGRSCRVQFWSVLLQFRF